MATHFFRELLSLGLDIIDGTGLGNKLAHGEGESETPHTM
jgi:hypothetical protein